MGRAINGHAWGRTPLGPISAWPVSLRTLTSVMLACPQPAFMAWGPQRTWLYNDAFIPILGAKHPDALGRPALAEVWAEATEVLQPLFDEVFAGAAVTMNDFSLQLDRGAGLQEAHFSFSYTPARDECGVVAGLFGVCTEITDLVVGERRRLAAERALDETALVAHAAAERVDLALRAGAIVGTWVWEVVADRFLADEQFARSFGVDPGLCRTGLPLERVKESIHPDDRTRVDAVIAQALGQGGGYRCEYRVLRSDGVYRWIEASGEVELDAAGRAVRFPGMLVDIEERRQTRVELEQANQLLRTFMEAVPGVIYAKDREGRLLVANRGTAQLLGRDFDDFIGRTDMELLDDKAEAAAVMANDRRIMESGVAEQLEEPVALADGSRALWLSTKAPLRDETGEVVGLVGSSVDITARRHAEEQRVLLLNELNHRVKNTLAVVQGLARQTFRKDVDVDAAAETFDSRLAALSRAHNLLTDANWQTVDLREIVLDQLPQAGARASTSGPSVRLAPQLAVSIALALHELGTNATKYGALSNETGRVQIHWSLDEAASKLHLRWEERGGPPVRGPRRRGFGSRLIERSLASEFGGEVKIQFPESGVICEFTAFQAKDG